MQIVDHMYHSDQKSLLRQLWSFAPGPESSHSRPSSSCSVWLPSWDWLCGLLFSPPLHFHWEKVLEPDIKWKCCHQASWVQLAPWVCSRATSVCSEPPPLPPLSPCFLWQDVKYSNSRRFLLLDDIILKCTASWLLEKNLKFILKSKLWTNTLKGMKGLLKLISTNFPLCQPVQCLSEETIADLVSVPCQWGELNAPHLPLSLGTAVMSAGCAGSQKWVYLHMQSIFLASCTKITLMPRKEKMMEREKKKKKITLTRNSFS